MENPDFSSQPEKLHFRSPLNWLYRVLIAIAVVASSFVAVDMLLHWGQLMERFSPFVFEFIIATTVILRLLLALRPHVFSFLQIFQDRLELNKNGKVRIFKFSEITSIRFSGSIYLGMGFQILSRGKNSYFFGTGFEKSGTILDAIVRFNPGLVGPNEFIHYRNVALAADRSWNRLSRAWRAKQSLVLKYLGFPAGLSAIIVLVTGAATKGIQVVIEIGIMALVTNFSLRVMFISFENLILVRQQLKKINQPSPASAFAAEQAIQRNVEIAYHFFVVAMTVICLVAYRITR